MSADLIHHGVMFSYYSAKTRAYLSYKRIPFVERHSGREMSGRIREVTRKVMIPVVELPDGEILQDTTVIIDTLEERYTDRPVIPPDPVMFMITRIAEFIIDELWISTAMNSRWNDPVSNEFAASEFRLRFGASMGLEGKAATALGEQVAGRMQSYLPHLGIAGEEGRAAASEYFRAASLALNRAVGATRYALGPRPTLIDFCLFTGYFAHQYRDPGRAQTFLKKETPRLCYYLDNLQVGHCAPETGDLTVSDELMEYLSVVGPSGAQFALGIAESTAAKSAEASPGRVFEERIEPFSFKLGDRPFSRGASTFSAWKAQRIFDVYEGMSGADRERAEAVAERIGWIDFLRIRPGYRLKREGHLTHLAGR